MAFLRQCLQELRTRHHHPGVVDGALLQEHPAQHHGRVARWPAEASANDAWARPPLDSQASSHLQHLQESNAMRAPEPGGVQV